MRHPRMPLGPLAWPVALAAALAALIGRQDVNLTDGGFILATSHRVLAGELPHADFITPRPGGSAFLHTIDLLLPGPLWLGSRTVAIALVIAYSALLAMLVLDRRFRALGLAGAAGAIAATLVNFHTFPPMAWHTIDGAFFTALGLVAVERGLRSERRGVILAGALALGAAPLMKQSFFAAPLLGLARVAWVARPPWRVLLAATGAMAVPGLAYVAVIAAAGGFGLMIDELTGNGQAVYGKELLDQLGAALPYALGAAVLTALPQRFAPWPQLALTALVLYVALSGRLQFDTPWSFRVFWIAVAVVVVHSVVRRGLDWPGVCVCALGWMVTLSWGAARPSLIAGSMALYVVVRAWQGVELPRPRLAPAAAAAAALVVVAAFAVIRYDRVFLPERPASVLTARLGGIAPAYRGVKTDPTTAEYLEQTRDCLARHPARWVAVLPEDSQMAVTFDVRNPFPMDWLWPAEYAAPGSRNRIVDAARRLGREGSYLVLIQKPTVVDLYAVPSRPLPLAAPGEPHRPFPFDGGLVNEILAPLTGQPITCGPFTGVYERRAHR